MDASPFGHATCEIAAGGATLRTLTTDFTDVHGCEEGAIGSILSPNLVPSVKSVKSVVKISSATTQRPLTELYRG